MVLWLLIGTRSLLLIVILLSSAEPLCPSRCLFGTILVTLCLMVWDWRVSRAEPMLSCRHDLIYLFSLLLFYLFLPFIGWLCGVMVFVLIECSHSLPALHSGLQIIIIILYNDFLPTPRRGRHVKSYKTHTQSSRYTLSPYT